MWTVAGTVIYTLAAAEPHFEENKKNRFIHLMADKKDLPPQEI